MIDGRLRVLVAAYGTVPGANAHSSALLGMAAGLRGDLDLVTRKTASLPHQSRLGEARLFRVRCSGDPDEQRATFARAVRRQLEAEPYDVVHVRGAWEGDLIRDLRRAIGFRFIYEVATFPDEAEGTHVEHDWSLAHERCLESADLVLVGAEASARALAERGQGGKVAVVSPGVDVDAYDWWPVTEDQVTRLLYVGPFSADREISTLLAAVRAVSSRLRLRVLLAGEPNPDRRAHVERMVDAFGVRHLVSVRGEPRAVSLPSLIAACDIAVVTASTTPRFQELGDLPEPLLEYLACRRPVVAAGVPAVAEVVRDEEEGVLYLPGDEISLADAIVSVATDADLRNHVIEGAYARVRARFSGAARRRRLAEVYEMLIPGSQSYDAWGEAFEQDTGAFAAPVSSMIETDAVEDVERTHDEDDDHTIAPPAPLPGEPTPALSDDNVGDTLVGQFPAMRAIDTSPELDHHLEPLEGSDTSSGS
ncbi:MAG: glycosyltransferase [Sandaracinus sp.]|nr:glycosyltransferase [Sandaracinus sp.]